MTNNVSVTIAHGHLVTDTANPDVAGTIAAGHCSFCYH